MAKYHNGPNGPGVCRARTRPCPFGGDEVHFDTKEEAVKAFEKKQIEKNGLLPAMKNTAQLNFEREYLGEHGRLPSAEILAQVKQKVKIICSNQHRIPLSNSNLVVSSGYSYQADGQYLVDLIKEGNMDSKEIISSLNKDKRILASNWGLESENENMITLKSEDRLGNVNYIKVKKLEEPKKPTGIASFNSNSVRTSLSNYLADNGKGSSESQEYITNLIKKGNFDGKRIADNLNNDSRVFGKWAVENENDEFIQMSTTDTSGNEDFIKIYK